MKTIFAFILIFLSCQSFAELEFEDGAIPELATSSRALGMGNAYLNKVDDSWAAFYNPAGLGTVRRVYFHLANFTAEVNSGLTNLVGDGPGYKIPENLIKTFEAEELLSELENMPGKLTHSRLSLFPNLTFRGFTLGYLYSQRIRGINDNEISTYELAQRRDMGPVAALNLSFMGGVLKLGASAVYLNRRELNKSIPYGNPLTIDDSEYKSGTSLQFTAGTRLTLPYKFLPTFSAVLRNATNSEFDGKVNQTPDSIEQTFDLGFSITPQIAKRARFHFEVNLRDVNNAYDTNAKRRLVAGTEIDFSRRIFLRAGWGDGWGSAGLGVRNRNMIVDLATYAVDRSSDGFREEEDRRWVFTLSYGL